MNKWMMRLLSVFVVIGLLGACGAGEEVPSTTPDNLVEENQSDQVPEVAEEVVIITISTDEGDEVISDKEVAIEDGDILMDVLKENYEIEEEGGFVNSIDGIQAEEDEQKAWMYFVNDEMAMVGAAEYELEVGDEVNFDLQAWE